MKNLSIIVTVTALVAFSVGYFARGPIERFTNVSQDTKKLTIREHAESPAEQTRTMVPADPYEANPPVTASVDREAFITSTSSTPRELYVKSKSNRLGDFFVINGIGADRAGQIIQDLVDADHYLAQKGNAMLDRHTAEKAELIARGDVVEITHTPEEKAEIEAERETRYRQIFGEFYEAYEIYRRSHPQRRVVGSFSSSLPEPLDYTTKEYMVQIMYEEQSRTVSEPETQSSGSDERLSEMRSFNDRVLNRTSAYLTPSQFEQFKKLLDDDIRRAELLTKVAELDKGR